MKAPYTHAIAAIALTGAWCGDAMAGNDVLFVLDSSNSMWGQVEGVAKIDTAKTALAKLMSDVAPDTRMGLMVYGHRDKSSCEDVELLVPVGQADKASVNAALEQIRPTGKTPIAYALEQTASAFADDASGSVVLISDGVETCDGDPCDVAGKLAAANVNVRVHVIGFDISEKDRAALECIAEKGKGKYFAADSTKGFSDAVSEAATLVAQAAPPPAPEPEKEEFVLYLEDEFDGEDVADHWEIINPNPDAYLVENGELLALSATSGSLTEETVDNLLHLTKPMPKGDWVATAKLNIDFQTERERIFFGLYNNKDDFLIAQISVAGGSCYSGGSYRYHMYLETKKITRGKSSGNQQEVWSIPRCDGGNLNELMAKAQPILLRISKTGRDYTSAIKLEGSEEPKWIEIPPIKLLRASGSLALGLYQSEAADGETSISVDWVKVEAKQ